MSPGGMIGSLSSKAETPVKTGDHGIRRGPAAIHRGSAGPRSLLAPSLAPPPRPSRPPPPAHSPRPLSHPIKPLCKPALFLQGLGKSGDLPIPKRRRHPNQHKRRIRRDLRIGLPRPSSCFSSFCFSLTVLSLPPIPPIPPISSIVHLSIPSIPSDPPLLHLSHPLCHLFCTLASPRHQVFSSRIMAWL